MQFSVISRTAYLGGGWKSYLYAEDIISLFYAPPTGGHNPAFRQATFSLKRIEITLNFALERQGFLNTVF